jgi:hypothetical protein
VTPSPARGEGVRAGFRLRMDSWGVIAASSSTSRAAGAAKARAYPVSRRAARLAK